MLSSGEPPVPTLQSTAIRSKLLSLLRFRIFSEAQLFVYVTKLGEPILSTTSIDFVFWDFYNGNIPVLGKLLLGDCCLKNNTLEIAADR